MVELPLGKYLRAEWTPLAHGHTPDITHLMYRLLIDLLASQNISDNLLKWLENGHGRWWKLVS